MNNVPRTIVILEANPPSPIFDNTSAHASWFVEFLSRLDASLKLDIYQVFRDELPNTVDGIDGIIITGSAKEVYDKESWIKSLEQFVNKAREKNVPILGVCFGIQLIAQASGGIVAKNPNGREVGTRKVQLTNNAKQDPLFIDIPTTLTAQESHQSAVVRLPPNATLLAQNEFGVQAFRLGNEPTWGVQFHPELSPDTLKKVVTYRKSILENEGINVDRCMREIGPTHESKKILTNFVRIVYDNKKS
jgi:GMP synthase (glutamine-hydrolysing)